jgi:hypothetical protein
MQYAIFILELIVIVFYVDVVYDTSNSQHVIQSNENYSAYYSLDVVDNTILTLNNLSEDTKINIWQSSPIQLEVLKHFPNMQRMQDIYKDRVIDNGEFKENFFNYMQELQDAFIAGEINEEEFCKRFLSPSL